MDVAAEDFHTRRDTLTRFDNSAPFFFMSSWECWGETAPRQKTAASLDDRRCVVHGRLSGRAEAVGKLAQTGGPAD